MIEDQKAVLRLEITSDDPKVILQAIGRLNEELGYSSKAASNLEKNLARALGKSNTTAATGTASGVRNVGAAAAAASKSAEELAGRLPRLRYALYDVATTANIAAIAVAGVGVAAVLASARFESAFTAVERTAQVSGDSAEQLRSQLIGLTRELPTNFQDVAGIATLGAQLDIAAGNLTEFTKVVTQFSATAGTTTEATAQGFGRIAQLLGTPVAEFENLGSAILYAGNTSVATEQDVLNYAQRLSIAGAEAKFTSTQIVALSATLASLGIGLEASQGATQRIFQQLGRDVEANADGLERLAAIAGTSAKEFGDAWAGDPQRAFSSLLAGLEELSNAGQLTGALDSIGIIETREVRLMTALANNLGFYNEQLQTTEEAYRNNTYLADSYAKVVDDLSSKWQIFVNSVTELASTAGDALLPVLGTMLDVASALANALSDVLGTGAGQVFAGIALTIGAIAAALLAATGTAALAGASFAAIKTALIEIGLAAGGASTGLKGFAGGMIGVTAATGGAATALNVFKIALISTGIGAAVVLLGTLAAAFIAAGGSAEASFDKFVGTTAGLSEALAADAEAYKSSTGSAREAYVLLDAAGKENLATFNEQAKAIEGAAVLAGVDLPNGFAAATGAVEDNTLAIGENTTAWLRNQLMQSDAFQNLGKNEALVDYFKVTGATIDDLLKAAVQNGEQGMLDYLQGIESTTVAQAAITSGKIKSALGSGFGNPGVQTTEGSQVLGTGLLTGSDVGRGFAEALPAIEGFVGQLALMGVEGQNAGDQTAAAAARAAAALDDAGSSASDMVNALVGSQNAALAMENSIFSLGSALAENGNEWSQFTESGRENMSQLLTVISAVAARTPGDTAATAANLQALFNMIVNGGYASAEQLLFLQNVIKNLAGGGEVKAAQVDFNSFFGGWTSGAEKAQVQTQKAQKAVREAAAEVRTLVDYARDLDSVFSRSYEIRFGPSQSMDSIQSSWNAIADANEASRDAIEGYQDAIRNAEDAVTSLRQEMSALGADKSTKQYFLQIAELYGDELRAAQLREEIAGINLELADTQKQLTAEQKRGGEAQAAITAEQENLNRGLNGNSNAALANRAALSGLVGGYQEYLTALAASGASQETLRAESQRLKGEFVAQATAMGFSRDELGIYSAAFDDFTQVINRVPRNITVGASIDPALQAFAEFEAAARAAAQNASNAIETGDGSGYRPNVDYGAWANAGNNAGTTFARALLVAYQNEISSRREVAFERARTGSGSIGGFASGGYTGNGGKYEPKGIVHGGEFVFSKQATNNLGVHNLSALHQMGKRGAGYADGGHVGGGATGAGFNASQMSQLARMIGSEVARQNPLVIPGVAIQRANSMSNAASNLRGSY